MSANGQIFQPEEIAPRVTREARAGYVVFAGRRDAITSAGFADPAWFADGQARDKRGRVIRRKRLTLPDGRQVRTLDAGRHAEVQIDHPEHERAAYWEQWQEWLADRRQPDDPRPRRVGNVIYLPARS